MKCFSIKNYFIRSCFPFLLAAAFAAPLSAQVSTRCQTADIFEVDIIKACLSIQPDICLGQAAPIWCTAVCDPLALIEDEQDQEMIDFVAEWASQLETDSVQCPCVEDLDCSDGMLCSSTVCVSDGLESNTAETESATDFIPNENKYPNHGTTDFYPTGEKHKNPGSGTFVPTGGLYPDKQPVNFVPSQGNYYNPPRTDFVPYSVNYDEIARGTFVPTTTNYHNPAPYDYIPQGGHYPVTQSSTFIPTTNQYSTPTSHTYIPVSNMYSTPTRGTFFPDYTIYSNPGRNTFVPDRNFYFSGLRTTFIPQGNNYGGYCGSSCWGGGGGSVIGGYVPSGIGFIPNFWNW